MKINKEKGEKVTEIKCPSCGKSFLVLVRVTGRRYRYWLLVCPRWRCQYQCRTGETKTDVNTTLWVS